MVFANSNSLDQAVSLLFKGWSVHTVTRVKSTESIMCVEPLFHLCDKLEFLFK